MNHWKDLEVMYTKYMSQHIFQEQMAYSQVNNNKLVYLQRMTGLKPTGQLTNSNYPHPHSNQELFDKDGQRCLRGPLTLKKQNEIASLPKINPAKPLIKINNHLECSLVIKPPQKVMSVILMTSKGEKSNYKAQTEQECSMGEMAETIYINS